MEDFNENAVRRIIMDMNVKLNTDINIHDYNHDQLVEIYNEIVNSDYTIVKQKYNQYFHEIVAISN